LKPFVEKFFEEIEIRLACEIAL